MSRFRPINREIDFLLPPSVQDWLAEGHLARYVVEEVVEGLDSASWSEPRPDAAVRPITRPPCCRY